MFICLFAWSQRRSAIDLVSFPLCVLFSVVRWTSLEAYANRQREGDFKIEKFEQEVCPQKIAFTF